MPAQLATSSAAASTAEIFNEIDKDTTTSSIDHGLGLNGDLGLAAQKQAYGRLHVAERMGFCPPQAAAINSRKRWEVGRDLGVLSEK